MKYSSAILALFGLLAISLLFQGCSNDLWCDINEFFKFADAIEVDGDEIIDISDLVTPRYTSETILIPEEVAISRIEPEDTEMLHQINANQLRAFKMGDTFVKVYTANNKIVARIPVIILSDGDASIPDDDYDGKDDNI